MVDVVQRQFDKPAYVTGVAAAAGSTVSEVTLTARNANGAPVPAVFDVFLSDSAAAIGYSGSTASGAVTIKTAGTTGTLVGTYLAKFGLRFGTLANGTVVISITDAAKTAFKVCVVIDGMPMVAVTLATASYGA